MFADSTEAGGASTQYPSELVKTRHRLLTGRPDTIHATHPLDSTLARFVGILFRPTGKSENPTPWQLIVSRPRFVAVVLGQTKNKRVVHPEFPQQAVEGRS